MNMIRKLLLGAILIALTTSSMHTAEPSSLNMRSTLPFITTLFFGNPAGPLIGASIAGHTDTPHASPLLPILSSIVASAFLSGDKNMKAAAGMGFAFSLIGYAAGFIAQGNSQARGLLKKPTEHLRKLDKHQQRKLLELGILGSGAAFLCMKGIIATGMNAGTQQ